MIAVVAAYDTESTAVPTRLLTSTGPGVTRAWAQTEWPELAASIGDRRVVTWGGGRWLEGACPERPACGVGVLTSSGPPAAAPQTGIP